MEIDVEALKAETHADRKGLAQEEARAAQMAAAEHEVAREAARRAGAVANPRLVLHEDPGRMGLMRAVRYLFSIPSNALPIIGSSLGYFYFAGLQTFALLYVKGHFHASQAAAELVLALLVGGAVVGRLLVAGCLTGSQDEATSRPGCGFPRSATSRPRSC